MGPRDFRRGVGLSRYVSVVHGLLCKKPPERALRCGTRTSTIEMFSFRPRSRESLLRQPFRGGALRIRYTENRS